MKLGLLLTSSALLATMASTCLAGSHARRGPTSPKVSSKHLKSGSKPMGQRAIDDSRATEIQTALIRSGYLSGEAKGHWDAETESAMQKFQGDNGWQTKLIPDSRAIIKLGLGPNQNTEVSSTGSSAISAQSSSAPVLSQQ